jgi:hypothetical protein
MSQNKLFLLKSCLIFITVMESQLTHQENTRNYLKLLLKWTVNEVKSLTLKIEKKLFFFFSLEFPSPGRQRYNELII